jgi:(S)-2-hydroxyglutarate dehydrogenase
MNDRSTVIIGGGIVGLATALAIHRRDPDAAITVIEKESGPAAHQTGRNSGVIHAGVYYKPGSEKAKMCTAGREAMVEFAKEHGIDHEVCGKLVVATEESERGRMLDLAERCKANNVPVELLGPAGMRDREPNVAGIAALWVSVTGIIDYSQVSWKMLDLLRGWR